MRIDVEMEWRNVEASIIDEVRSIHAKALERLRALGDSESVIQNFLETNFAREQRFFWKVLERWNDLDQSTDSRQTLVLFDIDETLGAPVRRTNIPNEFRTVIRPAAIPLLECLVAVESEIGLFTTRGTFAVQEQLEDQIHLGRLKPYVSVDQIYGRDGRDKWDTLEATEVQRRFGLIMNDLLQHDEQLYYSMNGGDFMKLAKLVLIRKRTKDRPILVVDDLMYPSLLNPQSGMYGVSLLGNRREEGEARFLLSPF